MDEKTMRGLISDLEKSPGMVLFLHLESLDADDRYMRKVLLSYIRARDRLLLALRRRVYAY